MASGDPCDKLSSLLGVFQDLREGSEMHTTQLRLSRLVYSEGLPFSKKNLELKQNITSKAERYRIRQLGRYHPPGYGLAVSWLHVLLLGLGMAAECAAN